MKNGSERRYVPTQFDSTMYTTEFEHERPQRTERSAGVLLPLV